ncbi:MAG: transglutaminase-like domain-containing protein [Thermodesulfobacteriota bacterium]|nr:transglutaminase-like domain-containing protein [Thermodesulfobacteriota bacterium]
MKKYWIAALLSAGVFAVLFSIRTGMMPDFFGQNQDVQSALPGGQALPTRDTWMDILQNGEKIGYTHTVFFEQGEGYVLKETVFMQLNAMDLLHRVQMETTASLTADLAIDTFRIQIGSGRFKFTATGMIEDNAVVVNTGTGGETRQVSIPVKEPPYLAAGALYAICNTGLAPGETMTFSVFDPSVMASAPARITVIGKEKLAVMDVPMDVTKVRMEFKGAEQFAWISENCEILKEAGILGLTLVKTREQDALSGISEKAPDITDLAAIPSNVRFDNPERLKTLKVEVTGVDADPALFATERQTIAGQVLTIKKEEMPAKADGQAALHSSFAPYLEADAFIQADDPQIMETATRVVSGRKTAVEKARALVDWIYAKIDKRAVASLPNAMETLENREGDCNEHAMLLAAMARAVGIPARVEAGVVYLDGYFYYHAWNTLYLGKWITADSAFGQIPADVTHIRMAGGSGDAQLDLMGLIGRVNLNVIEYSFADSVNR